MDLIKVLIVDDSLFMRTVLRDILVNVPGMKVVGIASNGKEALEMIPKVQPNIVTLDVEMPVLDGLSTLAEIMSLHPLPVLMFSALTQEGAKQTFEALDLGAVDYLPKPTGVSNLMEIKPLLIEKIRRIASVHVQKPKTTPRQKRIASKSINASNKIISIGASTGGPKALKEVLSMLPREMPPMMVVQHMPEKFTKLFAERLDKETLFHVKEAEDKDKLEPGLCLLAPGDWHMVVKRDKRVHLHKGPQVFGLRPTVDEMMISSAHVFSTKNIGVILTGMGSDGVKGMRQIKERGGVNIAQDEETSVIFGMPKAAINAGVVDSILPLTSIPNEIVLRC